MDPIFNGVMIENGEESILIATHGYLNHPSWINYINTLPQIKLAICPFNLHQLPFFLGGKIMPGMSAIRELIDNHNPSRIVQTHDENKHSSGLVKLFTKITLPSLEFFNDDMIQDRLLMISDFKPYQL